MAHPPMDRRLLFPSAARGCGSPPPRSDECHHRVLPPGALARLRDSKIVARSLRSAASARLLPLFSAPPSSTSSPTAAEGSGGGVPHFFLGSTRGPRYPLWKKLGVARSVVFLPPPMSPDTVEAFLNMFAAASELVAAH